MARPAPATTRVPEPVATPVATGRASEVASPDLADDLSRARSVGPSAATGPAGPPPDVPFQPAALMALQRSAGNRAVGALLQRDPSPPAIQRQPNKKDKKAGRARVPLEVSDLAIAIEQMPTLISRVTRLPYSHVKGSGRAHGATDDEAAFAPRVAAATIFARDAIYRFGGAGTLVEVEANFTKPKDPSNPDDLPPPKFPVPESSIVLIAEPATKRAWQLFELQDGNYAGEPFLGLTPPSGGYAPGDIIVLAYGSAYELAADVPGIPQPGYKAKMAAGAGEAPKWAKDQLERVRATLGRGASGGDQGGTGKGQAGAGPGGGGTDRQGTGTGTVGRGPGASIAPTPGKGRGGAEANRPRDRARPDKVVLWMGKRGPMLNVWAGGSAEAIPLRPGEADDALTKRVEESAARQTSKGKRLADSKIGTGFLGGHGGSVPSPDDLAEATKFTANAMAYPSKIAMQGGSGAEVSPKGWATTVTGANHDFDMILDWDAITFGRANQVWARLQWISFYWQVIDVGGMAFDSTTKSGVRGGARDASKHEGNVREPGQFEGMGAKVGRAATNTSEGLKEDRPDFDLDDGPVVWVGKAGVLAVQGLSATWDIAKSIVGAWVTKMLEPENRQDIHFENPGQFVVRCLANPIENDEIPEDRRTRRATSIAAFPVRVVNLDDRAKEVNREEQTDIASLQRALDLARKALAEKPDDPARKATVAILEAKLTEKLKDLPKSTTERLGDDLKSFDLEIAALVHLKLTKGSTVGLTGPTLAAAQRLKNELGILAMWQVENRLEDVLKARKAKDKQVDTAKSWTKDLVKPGTEVRPRVTLASEENGSIIRMAMILGQAPGSTDAAPRWSLLDVTSPKTQEKYEGSSGIPGPAGHGAAITEAFQSFADKAGYGRGTIAIEIPNVVTLGTKSVPATMLMKPGEFGRWKQRLQNLVEIASLVAPFAQGGRLATFASIGGALDSGYRLYDRAVNDRLNADFETIMDVVGVLGPFIDGARALSELQSMAKTKTGYVLRVMSRGGDLMNSWSVPASLFHDIEQIVRDTQLGGPEKQAAIAMILGRAMRDKVVNHLGDQRRHAADQAHGAFDPPPLPRPDQATRPHPDPVPVKPTPDAVAPRRTAPEPEPVGDAGGRAVPAKAIRDDAGGGGGSGGGSAAYEPGMPRGSVQTLKAFSQQYHVVVDVRPPSPRTGSRLAEGALPKPAEVKAKTINEADRLLGAPAGSLGLVGYFKPELPTRPRDMGEGDWQAVMERYAQRAEEFTNLADDMRRLTADGTVRVEGGLVKLLDPRGVAEGPDRYRAMTGDVDIYEIHWADGRKMTDEDANRFAGKLMTMDIGVAHGAHLRWIPQTAKDKKTYQDIIAKHAPGESPLLRFEPGAEPQRVNGDTPVPVRPGPRTEMTEVSGGPPTRPGGGDDGSGGGPGGGGRRTRDEDPIGPNHGRTLGSEDVRPAPRPASDLIAEPRRPPSIPTGVVFEPRLASRYEVLDKPKQGQSDSYRVRDLETGKVYLFKPTSGEQAVDRAQERGIRQGDYAPRTKAAEIVAKKLGLDTPPVELVAIGSKTGSLTEWVNKMSLLDLRDTNLTAFTEITTSDAFKKALSGIDALDYLINNVDRSQNLGNYLIELTPQGTFKSLAPIDHDLTFTSTGMRAKLPDYTRALPAEYSPAMQTKLQELSASRQALIDAIRPLVGDEAIPGVVRRLDELLADMRNKQRHKVERAGG